MQWREHSWQTSSHRDRWGGHCRIIMDPLLCIISSSILYISPYRLRFLSNENTGLLQWNQSVCSKRDHDPVPGRSGEKDQGHPSGWPSAGWHSNGSTYQQAAAGESAGICHWGQEAGVLLIHFDNGSAFTDPVKSVNSRNTHNCLQPAGVSSFRVGLMIADCYHNVEPTSWCPASPVQH